MIKSEQDKRDRRIRKLYLEGKTKREIALKFGLSTQQIYNILVYKPEEDKKRLDK